MSAAHALIGPSSLKRTINCPGSIRELRKLERRSSDAADEGSCLHAYAEEILLSDGLIDPHDLIGKTYEHNGYRLTIAEEHADCIVDAIDWIRQQNCELMLVECRVSLDPWMPGQFGTADLILICVDENGDYYAIVFDWKFGVGVPVKVENNEQEKAYGLAVLHTVLEPRGITPKYFRLIIEQPRNHKGGRYYEPWDISLEDLLEFGETLKATYAAVMDPNAPCVAGEWCADTFCDVRNKKGGCSAYNVWMRDLMAAKFDDDEPEIEPTFEDPDQMTPKRRGYIVKHAAAVRAFLAKLHEDSMEAAIRGSPDPPLKLVAGQRGNRYFTDEDDAELIAEAALGAQAFNKKLKSIAQLEKDLKPGRKRVGNAVALAALNELVAQDDGKPVLVDASDPRPALKTADDLFDDDEDDNL